jgi:hypothetical protein
LLPSIGDHHARSVRTGAVHRRETRHLVARGRLVGAVRGLDPAHVGRVHRPHVPLVEHAFDEVCISPEPVERRDLLGQVGFQHHRAALNGRLGVDRERAAVHHARLVRGDVVDHPLVRDLEVALPGHVAVEHVERDELRVGGDGVDDLRHLRAVTAVVGEPVVGRDVHGGHQRAPGLAGRPAPEAPRVDAGVEQHDRGAGAAVAHRLDLGLADGVESVAERGPVPDIAPEAPHPGQREHAPGSRGVVDPRQEPAGGLAPDHRDAGQRRQVVRVHDDPLGPAVEGERGGQGRRRGAGECQQQQHGTSAPVSDRPRGTYRRFGLWFWRGCCLAEACRPAAVSIALGQLRTS